MICLPHILKKYRLAGLTEKEELAKINLVLNKVNFRVNHILQKYESKNNGTGLDPFGLPYAHLCADVSVYATNFTMHHFTGDATAHKNYHAIALNFFDSLGETHAAALLGRVRKDIKEATEEILGKPQQSAIKPK